jgi:phosphopantothenoylcysteine synthetase/decarboxylase
MNILITSGGCREFIDAVRFITNFSTGSTGAFLADFFHDRGARVHFVSSQGAVEPKKVPVETTFTSFLDLNEKLEGLLAVRPVDVILHVAAVSDFSISRIEQGSLSLAPVGDIKLASDEPLVLKLKPNFKIVSRLKKYAKLSAPRVVGFKLTRHDDETEQLAAVHKLFEAVPGGADHAVDWVVHNDLNDINVAQDLHRGKIYSPKGALKEFHTKHQMAEALWSIIGGNSEVRKESLQ